MDDKELNQALGVVAVSKPKIESGKRAALAKFLASTDAADRYAAAAIDRLRTKNLAVAAFADKIEGANVGDGELDRMLFDLRNTMGKPDELHKHRQERRAVEWKGISSPPFNDQVDEFKFNSLVQHFVRCLSKFGDTEGFQDSLVERIKQRVVMLAECARRDGRAESFTLNLPEKEPEPLEIIGNLSD